VWRLVGPLPLYPLTISITGWFTNTWNVSELEQTGAAEDKTVVTMTGGAAAALTCQAGYLLLSRQRCRSRRVVAAQVGAFLTD
jgi:hypothetical protein